MKISLSEVQANIANIANRDTYTRDIIYELLAAYGRSKSAITQLREGHLNKAEDSDSVLQKDVVYFKTLPAGASLEHEVTKLHEDPLTERYKPRYLITTDLVDLAARDNLKNTTLTIKLADIDDHLDFFYSWTGDEVVDQKTEAVADRRAADKMNELYLEIEKQNRSEFAKNPHFRHELNIFFSRLLFCFFAEDTGIYKEKQFTNAIKTYSQPDGSDLAWFFNELFTALDTEEKASLKAPFKDFPYVNGSIFNTKSRKIAIPMFSAHSRHLILECGRQNWGQINPDIFGTIFQGVVDPAHRDENGMDYTSVPNIMKVIKPLFLDHLHEQFVKYYDDTNKLWSLLGRIYKIKIFDPACGSGNFLIIAYKELRRLQHAIIARIDELMPGGIGVKIPDSQLINIHNFYGIEIDDFAHELAVLSLFLAKHQMNQEFTEQFGKHLSIIPLIDIPTIVQGNAARLDWREVCPNTGSVVKKADQVALFDFGEPEQISLVEDQKVYDEIYLIGNPPYKGSRKQTADMKNDMKIVFQDSDIANYKVLDYICIWFHKGANYINRTKAQLAFVSTNSVSQGDQVGIFWPSILDAAEIGFAYTSFKWQNSARDNAGVTCVIISLRNPSKGQKYLFNEGIAESSDIISAYLSSGTNTIVMRRKSVLSAGLPPMSAGNYTGHAMNLTLNKDERDNLLESAPNAQRFIKKLVGSDEMIKGLDRWCLWISNEDYDMAYSIPGIKERIDATKEARIGSKDPAANKLASRPHQFRDRKETKLQSVVVPVISSENREYIPLGIVGSETILSNRVVAVYDTELYVFGLLSSAMHMAWIGSVCGRLETRYSYSVEICYNTFPLKTLTESEKDSLSKAARKILLARAAHPAKTLAELYDPKKMPADLREAHDDNDRLVDNLYKKGGFTNDEDRLATLFRLYEEMTGEESTK